MSDTGPQNADSQGHEYHQKLLGRVNLPSELIVCLPLVILLLLSLSELLAQGSASLFFLILWLDRALFCLPQSFKWELFCLLYFVHQLIELFWLESIHFEKLNCHLGLHKLTL